MAVDATYSLITVEELQNFLAYGDDEYPAVSSHIAILEAVIDGVSRWFHEYTHRQLKSAELTEYYDGDGSFKLYLNSWPVTESAFYQDAGHDFGDDTAFTPDLTIDNEVIYDGGFPRGTRNIKVVYTAGWSAGDIPQDLVQSCLITCQVWLRNQRNDSSGVGQISIAGSSVQMNVEKLAPPIVMDVLNRYRRTA